MGKVTLVIHGGAGPLPENLGSEELERPYHNALQTALLSGYKILQQGGSSIEAVLTATMMLEDCPLFNAGKGSVFTAKGTHEMDAAIMDGNKLKAGSVCSVSTIKNPILLALKVLEHSEHVMLSGLGAHEFALTQNIEIVSPDYFFTTQRFEQWQKSLNENKFGTVGAVACDALGNLASATSTGGMNSKKWGRIGDSPIIGAGTYANNKTCAVSGTGHGEYFIRAVLAYDISALMEYKNLSLEQACYEAIQIKMKELGGVGGAIAIDNQGHFSMTFNCSRMYRGHISEDGIPHTFI